MKNYSCLIASVENKKLSQKAKSYGKPFVSLLMGAI